MPGYGWSYVVGVTGVALWVLTNFRWKSTAIIGGGGLALGLVLQLETMR